MPWQSPSYGFDPMGNRTSKSGYNTVTESYSFDGANRQLTHTAGGATYTYANDLNGNVESNGRPLNTPGRRLSTWDWQNRMVGCTFTGPDENGATKTWTSDFTYGQDGLRRVGRVQEAGGDTVTTQYRLDGPSVVREDIQRKSPTDQITDETVTYLMGARGPEYRRVTSGTGTSQTTTTRWHAFDGLGSVIGEIGADGELAVARQLDVYGNARFWAANQGEKGGKLKFVGGLGHPSDVETGLVYMRARFMDSITGRNRIDCCRHRKG